MLKKEFGFTLIELMVTVVVAMILVAVGAPALNSLYEGSRSDSGIRKIQQSLMFARSQAVSYGSRVTVCPMVSNACSGHWIDGFTIFIDNGAVNVIDGADQVIRVIDSFNSSDFVTVSANAVSFTPDGLVPTNAAITFTYCPGSVSNDQSTGAEVSVSGRIRFISPPTSCS